MAKDDKEGVITVAGRRGDEGWENRGWMFTQDELNHPPSLRDNM